MYEDTDELDTELDGMLLGRGGGGVIAGGLGRMRIVVT